MAGLYRGGGEAALADEFAPVTNVTDADVATTYKRLASGGSEYGIRTLRATAGQAYVNPRWVNTTSSTARHFARVYFKVVTAPSARTCIARVTDGSGNWRHARIDLDNSLVLRLMDAVDTQVGGTYAISLNTWYRLEWAADANSANVGGGVSLIEARLYDASAETTLLWNPSTTTGVTDTGYNTVSFGLGVPALRDTSTDNTNISQSTLASASVTGEIWWDDCAVNDNSGTSLNTWHGPGTIVLMRIDSAGDSAPSTGTFADVDEFPFDTTTQITVTATATTGYFNLEPSATRGIPSGATINNVAVCAYARGATATACNWIGRLKSVAAGTAASGTARIVSTVTFSINSNTANNTKGPSYITAVDPSNTANPWTTTLLDSAQVGFGSSDISPVPQASAVYLLVDFVPVVSGGTNATVLGVVAAADGAAPLSTQATVRQPTVAGVQASAQAAAPLATVVAQRVAAVAGVQAITTADALLASVAAVRQPTVLALASTATAAALLGTQAAQRQATELPPAAAAAADVLPSTQVAGGVATPLAVPASATAAAQLSVQAPVRQPTVAGTVVVADAAAQATTQATQRQPVLLPPVADAMGSVPLPAVSTGGNAAILPPQVVSNAVALPGTLAAVRQPTTLPPAAQASGAAQASTQVAAKQPVVLPPLSAATAAANSAIVAAGGSSAVSAQVATGNALALPSGQTTVRQPVVLVLPAGATAQGLLATVVPSVSATVVGALVAAGAAGYPPVVVAAISAIVLSALLQATALAIPPASASDRGASIAAPQATGAATAGKALAYGSGGHPDIAAAGAPTSTVVTTGYYHTGGGQGPSSATPAGGPSATN